METLHQYLDWYCSKTLAHYLLATYMVFLIIELIFGRRERASRKDVVFNCVYLLTVLTVYIAVRPFCVALANDLAKPFGGPYLDLTFNADGEILQNFAAGLMLIFIYDLFYYWHHRLQHVSELAWSTHKLHHSDENLGVTTAYKHHWTDDMLRTFTILLPMGVLFKLEPVTIFLVNYLIAMQGLLIHSNIDLDFGPLNFITVSPKMHRIHHSKLLEHQDKNFTAVFTLCDHLFGTYCAPEKSTPPTGLDSGSKMETLFEAHFYPFRDWWNYAKGRLAI